MPRIQKIRQFPILYHATKEGWTEDKNYHKFEVWPSEIPTAIIEIETTDGLTGVGEALVSHWYYGNTLAHVVKSLQLIEAKIVGLETHDLFQIERLMSSVLGHGAPSVRAAQDAVVTAILDIIGQDQAEPIYNLLGGSYRTSFDLMTNLYLSEPDLMAEQGKEFVKKGYTGLKVKCGSTIQERGWSLENILKDVKKITKTLESVPENVAVDGDCNQSWGSPHRTISLIRSYGLERYPNFAIEQPVHYTDLRGASKIANSVTVPVILDESVMSAEALMQIVQTGSADRIVIKPSRVGGLLESRRIITIAEAAGIGVSLDNGPSSIIGDTVLCHLGATVKDSYPICADLSTWVNEKPVRQSSLVLQNGKAKIGSSSGLGIKLDYEILKEMSVDPLRQAQ